MVHISYRGQGPTHLFWVNTSVYKQLLPFSDQCLVWKCHQKQQMSNSQEYATKIIVPAIQGGWRANPLHSPPPPPPPQNKPCTTLPLQEPAAQPQAPHPTPHPNPPNNNVQSTLSKWTLSKPDTSLKRTNLVPAKLHLYLCNWTLSKADTSLSQTADTFFSKFGSKPLKTDTAC